MPVDRRLDQVRLCELCRGAGEDRHERDADLTPVRAQVREQAPHQPRVVGLAEDFVVVEAAHRSSRS